MLGRYDTGEIIFIFIFYVINVNKRASVKKSDYYEMQSG